jgi:hypothetical protein
MPRYEKAKSKARTKKRRSSGAYKSDESHVQTVEEVVDRTLNGLRNLGNQTFAIPPFSEHFDRWLIDVKVVLSEFESSPTVNVDDQFLKERSQTLSNVEVDLEEVRRKEATGEQVFKALSNDRILLEQIEEEYTTRTKEIEERKDSEIRRLSSNVDGLKEELDRIVRMKTGIFRGISKKAKAQKEADATHRLSSAKSELDLAVQNFAAEQERLRDEHEKRKQPLIEQVRDYQKEVENQEIDSSLEARRVACEALAGAVNALLQRNASSPH